MAKKKTYVILIALAMVIALIPQSAEAASTTAFSQRPVIQIQTCSQTSVKISWNKVSGADGYEIYRALPGKSFQKIKTVKSPKTLRYVNKGLARNTAYYFKVRAYKTVNGKKVYGKYSWSKQGSAGISEEIRGFSAYSSDKENIYMHWYNPESAEGVLIYRSDSQDGAYKQIAKVPRDPELGTEGEYKDSGVAPGKTYYYKARPYTTYNGKLIKGKLTKVSSKTAMYYNPVADVTIMPVPGNDWELIFKVTMAEYSFDTEFFIGTEEGSEIGTIELRQYWVDGTAEESRWTKLEMVGISLDGVTYQSAGSVKVGSGKTVYIKASAGEPISVGTSEKVEWDIYCRYNGEYNAVSSNIG